MARSLGVIEGSSYLAVMSAVDRATKAADVRVERYEKVGEHDVAVLIGGDTADIQIALKAAHDSGNGVMTTILTNTRLRGRFGLPRL